MTGKDMTIRELEALAAKCVERIGGYHVGVVQVEYDALTDKAHAWTARIAGNMFAVASRRTPATALRVAARVFLKWPKPAKES